MCRDVSNQGENNLSLFIYLCFLVIGGILGGIVGAATALTSNVEAGLLGSAIGAAIGAKFCSVIGAIVGVTIERILVGRVKPLGVLVGLAELFILTIVIALFANKFTGYSIIIPVLNSPTISLTSAFLFVVSIIISVLTGFVINQRLEARKQVAIKEENIKNISKDFSENIKQVWDDIYLSEDSKENIEKKIQKYKSRIEELEQKKLGK